MQLSTFSNTAAEWRAGRKCHDIDGHRRREMQFAKSGFEQAALGAARNEGRGFSGCNASRRCVQHGTELIGVIGLDDAHQSIAEAERCDDGSRRLNNPPQAERIVTGFCTRQQRDAGCAVSEQRSNRLGPNLRDFVDLDREYICRQAVAEPRQRVDERRAMVAIMKQHDGIGTASLAIGLHKRA